MIYNNLNFFDTIERTRRKVEMFTEEKLFEKETCNGSKFSLSNNFGWTEKQKSTVKVNKLEDVAGQISQSEAQELVSKKLDNKIEETISNSNLSETVQENLQNIAQKYNLKEEQVKKLIENTKSGKYDGGIEAQIKNNEFLENNQQIYFMILMKV